MHTKPVAPSKLPYPHPCRSYVRRAYGLEYRTTVEDSGPSQGPAIATRHPEPPVTSSRLFWIVLALCCVPWAVMLYHASQGGAR